MTLVMGAVFLMCELICESVKQK